MKRWLIVAVALAVPFAACKKQDSTAAPSPSASVSAAPSGAASLTALTAPMDSSSAAAAPDPDQIPTPAAHTTQAAQSISTSNYKTELDTIEKEINGIK